jgi:hypothetical protein
MEKRRRFWLTALSTLVGVMTALVLVGLTVILPATSAISQTWSGPMVYHGVGPRGVGLGGPDGPTGCTLLHVQFNGSGPIDSWVAPGSATVYQNGTISKYWASAGPAAAGDFVVQVPSSITGYRVVLFNPSWTVTLPSMQFETAEAAC